MRSPAKKKGAPYFVQSRSEAKLYKQRSTEKLFILNLENRDLEPKLKIRKGRLFVQKIALKSVHFG